MQKYPNVVQAEFFHIGGRGSSPEQVYAEGLSRAMTGLEDILAGMDPDEVKNHIKTCVRFYDYDGSIGKIVARAEKADKKHLEVAKKLESTDGRLRRLFLKYRLLRLLETISSERPRTHKRAVAAITSIIRKKLPMAVEYGSHHRFRFVRDDERHELLESIKSARDSSWIFYYKHNDLLADENKVLVSAF